MNKSSVIGAVLLSSTLISYNNLTNNSEEKKPKSITKPNVEVVSLSANYLDEIKLESAEEKLVVEQSYEKYTISRGTKVWKDETKTEEITIDNTLLVSLIETHGKNALILFENGVYGYTNTSSLIKCADIYASEYKTVTENNMVILNNLTKVYNANGMYLESKYPNTMCYVNSVNNEYAHVQFEDGTEGYVALSSLLLLSTKVDGFAYIKNMASTYNDKELTNQKGSIYAGELVYVSFICDNYAFVMDGNGDTFYMDINDLDKDFIIINLNEQKMYCFLDCKLATTYGTRSGRDSSPTHTGDFDIDWKTENWEFTTFPGSYARHWIPINEYGEGIHDLIGDDETNYGNNLYHDYGSHGCIRVPAAASQFVYDNYEVGDMVLVRKK